MVIGKAGDEAQLLYSARLTANIECLPCVISNQIKGSNYFI